MSQNELAMSDEEFEKLPVPVEGENDGLQNEEEESESTTNEEVEDTESDATEASDEQVDTEVVEEVVEPTEEDSELDYKAVYQEVFKPFKANGKEMKVDSIEDVRQLMQMGANYNKKMAALKPNLKLVKLLENNGLLDEEKLSYLIDLDKKNPDAIKKLIKESGLDPLDVDISQEVSYKPNTYNVNDKEMELDAVLSEIRETDTFNTTIDIIGNKWDDNSKRVLLDNPNVIKIINSHVESGVYATITDEVGRLRTLGRLEGMSDIDAYKAVGDALYAPRQDAHNINTATSKATNKEDPRLKDRKRAASTTKSVAGNVKPDFNPLSMSDDEFEKIASSKFI